MRARGSAGAGVAFALGAYLLWGLTPIYWKAVDSVPLAEMLAHRALWSLAVGLLGVGLSGGWRELRGVLRSPRRAALTITSALLMGVSWVAYVYGVQVGKILSTSLGFYVTPLMSVALGVLVLRERLTRAQALALALAAAGVGQLAWRLGEPPWLALVLASSFALYGLVWKLQPVTPLVGFALEMMVLAPPAAAYLVALGIDGNATFPLGAVRLDALVACAGLVTALPLIWFTSAAQRLRLVSLGFFQYIAPSVGFALAVGLYGESFTRAHAIGFGCVWSALVIFSLDSLRGARATPPPPEV